MILCALLIAYLDPGSSLPILSGFLGLVGFLLMVGMVPIRLAANGVRRFGRVVRSFAGSSCRGAGSLGRRVTGFARRLDL
ncbi:MAG TPA: hypothetical protein VG406_20535 [Isosphaeraceae bacterium]|jgi:hypothetical protein|nr:hypothetical protein [Isosphaeraceae bacterium]